MSNSIFQSVILQLKEACDRTIGVIDTDGCVVSSTDINLLGERWPDAALKAASNMDVAVTFNQKTFRAIISNTGALEYAVFCLGDDDSARAYCNLAYIALNDAKTFYEEKHDRGHSDVSTVDVLGNLFPDKMQDFVISINETDVAIIKQLSGEPAEGELEAIAKNVEDSLRSELFIKCIIGIGTIATHLRELADAYKEAQTAIDVGKVFDTEKSIINYENLGIGRLIYQLPTTLCEIFLLEVFKKNSIDALDQETLFTINKFFENNLNVSETSRKLFVHRNTLVYRLEKIKKLTGLDLREFDHAIVFKVALMVRKYLSSRDSR